MRYTGANLFPKFRLQISITVFRGRILAKTLKARLFRSRAYSLKTYPEISVFISSFNTRFALEMTIQSLLSLNRYPFVKLIIAENASNDGSLEFLERLSSTLKLTIITADSPRPHGYWLDEILQTCDTKYLFAIDSDMLFTGGDPLTEMVDVMEQNPSIYLLSAGLQPWRYALTEPVGNVLVDQSESPFTWMMCIRTELRTKVSASFSVLVEKCAGKDGRPLVNDTGAIVLQEIRKLSLEYGVMPKRFATRFEHMGSMSWKPTSENDESNHVAFARYKARYVEARAKAMLRGQARPKPMAVAEASK